MEARKLQKVGNRSYSICLPKKWVSDNSLREQESVFVEINRKNEIIIKTGDKSSRRPSEITTELSKIEDVEEFIVFCYVRNVDRVTLSTQNADFGKIRSVKRILKYLDGYDVTSEDENKIVISFLFKDFTISLPSIRRRMMYLLTLLVDSVEKKDTEAMEELETNVDRLYHLSKRILFSSLGNTQMKEENSINSDEDMFPLQLIYKKIENIADAIFSLRYREPTAEDLKCVKRMIEMMDGLFQKKETTSDIKVEVRKIMEKYHAEEGGLGAAIYKIADLCKDITENVISLRFDLSYFKNNENQPNQ